MIEEPYQATTPENVRLLTRAETVQLLDHCIDDAENWVMMKIKAARGGDRLELLSQLDVVSIIRERMNARIGYRDAIAKR